MTASRMQIQLNRTVTRRLKAVADSIGGASPMSVVMTALNIHLEAMERRAAEATAVPVGEPIMSYIPPDYGPRRLVYATNLADHFIEFENEQDATNYDPTAFRRDYLDAKK